MDAKSILDTLNKGLDFAEQLAPMAASLGVPYVGMAVPVVAAIAEVASNTLTRVEESAQAIGSADIEAIRAVTARLRIVNDALAEQVASS